MIVIEVIGMPAPKGSPQVVTRGRGGRVLPFPLVLADSERTKCWAKVVAASARAAMASSWRGAAFKDEALEVHVVFRMQRPAGHFGNNGLRPSAPRWPSVKPDLDKLIRATMDPLEGVVFDGDSRIVSMRAIKRYCAPGESPGARIEVVSVSSTATGAQQ